MTLILCASEPDTFHTRWRWRCVVGFATDFNAIATDAIKADCVMINLVSRRWQSISIQIITLESTVTSTWHGTRREWFFMRNPRSFEYYWYFLQPILIRIMCTIRLKCGFFSLRTRTWIPIATSYKDKARMRSTLFLNAIQFQRDFD